MYNKTKKFYIKELKIPIIFTVVFFTCEQKWFKQIWLRKGEARNLNNLYKDAMSHEENNEVKRLYNGGNKVIILQPETPDPLWWPNSAWEGHPPLTVRSLWRKPRGCPWSFPCTVSESERRINKMEILKIDLEKAYKRDWFLQPCMSVCELPPRFVSIYNFIVRKGLIFVS